MLFDLYHNVKVTKGLLAASITNSATGTEIDTLGYKTATFAVNLGTLAVASLSGKTVKLMVYESNTSGSGYTAVADADLLGNAGTSDGCFKSCTLSTDFAQAYKAGYIGDKRYLKVYVTFSAAIATATPVGAVAILGDALEAPVA